MTIKTASVLAFERKLANSDGLMYACDWVKRQDCASWQPVMVKSKDLRGTTSNRFKNAIQNDPMKLDAKIEGPNLQRVDVAALPFDTDTLILSFSLRVLGDLATPSACNDPEYREVLASIIKEYIETHGFRELSHRYAANIANGRFLWRNRVGAEAFEIQVKHMRDRAVQHEWIFNGDEYSLRSFPEATGSLAELADIVREGLIGKNASSFLLINAFARLGAGQEVFPSQELVLDNSRDNKKSKTLYQVEGVAALHSQKIGNALRTIDTWYPDAHDLGPIAVEPYGSVTNRGKAYRQPKDKMDFYTLLDKWVIQGHAPDIEQQHFVMATLVRGGVFGEKSE